MILSTNHFKQAHEIAVEKGFWKSQNRNRDELFCLVNTELSEAVEAHRKDKLANQQEFDRAQENRRNSGHSEEVSFVKSFEEYIKDTVEDEIADAAIRLMDWFYFRDRGYTTIPDKVPLKWEDNFAANIFQIQRRVCSYEPKTAFRLILDLSDRENINLKWHVETKMKYNSNREYLHGKNY